MEGILGLPHVSYSPENFFAISKMHREPELIFGITSMDEDAKSFIRTAKLIDSVHIYAAVFLIRQLKISHLWEKLLLIYPFLGGNADVHTLNLKSPGNSSITFNGTWTHKLTGSKPGSGVSDNGTINVNASSIASTTSAHMSYYSRTQVIETSCDLGVVGFSATTSWQMGFYYNGVGKFCEAWNQTAGAGRVILEDRRTTGFMVSSRTSGTDLRMYYNGSQIGGTSSSTPIGTVPSFLVEINGSNGNANHSTKECAFISFGTGLTAEDVVVLHYIVQKYQSLLGRAV